MESQEVVNTWENNRRTVLLNNSNEPDIATKKQKNEQYALHPIYDIVKVDKSKATNFEEYSVQLIRFCHGTEVEQSLCNRTLHLAMYCLYRHIQNCIDGIKLNNKFLFFKEEKSDFSSRPLSKSSNSEEFLGVHGAQDCSVLDVCEDPSTGATRKLPEGRRFRKSSSGFTRKGLLIPEPSSSVVLAPKLEKKIIAAPIPEKIEKKRIFTIKSNGIPKNMTGLEWFGNHCYANAAFQLLFACNTVRDFVKGYSGENNFLKSVQELFNAMANNGESIIKSQNNGGSIGLRTLYTGIGQAAKNAPIAYGRTVRELGSSSDQKDAYELLGEIVNEVAKSEEKLKGLRSNISCPTCGKIVSSIKVQDSCLEINISGNNVDECLRKTYAPEVVEYECQECGNNVNATVSREFEKLPDVLILRLKRFLFTIDGKQSKITKTKISTNVAYNETLNIHHELLSNDLKNSNPQGVHYKLRAIVNHGGSLDGGHYTATIFNDKDNKWYNADGASINLVNKNGHLQQSPNAYVFMYTKYMQK
jgi:ubiquitin C-terminal hydrolase